MVEYTLPLDSVFGALSDPTRRDILRRVAANQLSISQIAKDYNLTFAAVSKHLKVLERAMLVVKKRRGKEQIVSLAPQSLSDAAEYLDWYKDFWELSLDSLSNYLEKEN